VPLIVYPSRRSASKWFLTGTLEQFTTLLQCLQAQQQGIGAILNQVHSPASTLPRNLAPTPRQNDHYNKAKYEDIICRPLKPLYDGST
jgi:hypothetical protein